MHPSMVHALRVSIFSSKPAAAPSYRAIVAMKQQLREKVVIRIRKEKPDGEIQPC